MTASFSSSQSQEGVYHWCSGACHERSISGSLEKEFRERSPLALARAAAIPRFGRRCCSPTNTAAASAGTTCALAATNGWQRLGLEAAHIKWFQARGPDVVQNGLALCSLHHKIFDLGAFTVLPGNHQIVFSRHLHLNGRR